MHTNEDLLDTVPLFGVFGNAGTHEYCGIQKNQDTGTTLGYGIDGNPLDSRFHFSLNHATYLIEYHGAPIAWWNINGGWIVPFVVDKATPYRQPVLDVFDRCNVPYFLATVGDVTSSAAPYINTTLHAYNNATVNHINNTWSAAS